LALAALILYGIFSFSAPIQAADAPPPPAAATASYARLADLVLASPAIATARVKSIIVLKADRAPDVSADRARFYVEAETIGLIRGDSVISRKISFLLDGPAAKSKKPGLKGRTLILFGKVGKQVDQFQLTSSAAALDWTPANETLVRKVLADAMAADLPPAIKGVSSAFHVPGSITGEGETQIFLDTTNDTPVSLSVIRRPDEQPHFSASLGEIVDESAALPPPGTMLWYRLSCGLPERLPSQALRELSQGDASAATRDYNAFREALVPCERTSLPVI
jgi:hypothetical protein